MKKRLNKKAIADYNYLKSIGIHPKYLMRIYKTGHDYLINKLYNKAIREFTDAIELYPRFALAYEGRGVAYGKKKLYDKAIYNFTQAIKINTKYSKVYYLRGLAYYRKSLLEKSCNDFCQAGLLYLQQGNQAGVLECIAMIKLVYPSSSLIIKLLDEIHKSKSRKKK